MKISYKGDYALKAVLDLSFHYRQEQVVPLVDIAARQNVPVKYLEQIMLVLKGAGVVESKRGIGGGFMLRRPPQEITVGEIVRLMDGPTEPISCGKHQHDGSCGEESSCALREIWITVAEATSQVIDRVNFSQLMQRTLDIRERQSALNYQI